MASDNAGEGIGAFILFGFVLVAIVVGVTIVVCLGALIGSGVGFINYYKSFRANVRFERPGGV